jgi:hypothetical protein
MKPSTLRARIQRLNITREEISEDAKFGGHYLLTADRERKMLSKVTRKTFSRQRRESSIYGTPDFIAKHVFHGEEKMVSYARLVAEDGDTLFQAFVLAYDRNRARGVPRAYASLATLLQECGITATDFCMQVLGSCMRRGIDISNMYAGLAHDKVVQRNITQALTPKGVEDRKMFLTATGWLPVPRGSIIHVKAQATAGAIAQAAAGEKTENTPLPDFEEMTVAGSKIVRGEFEDRE